MRNAENSNIGNASRTHDDTNHEFFSRILGN